MILDWVSSCTPLRKKYTVSLSSIPQNNAMQLLLLVGASRVIPAIPPKAMKKTCTSVVHGAVQKKE